MIQHATKRNQSGRALIALLLLTTLLIACGGEATPAEPAPTSISDAAPVAESETAVPDPTATPLPPSPTPTDEPLAAPPTPEALPTATASPTPSASPTPVVLLNAEDFGEARNPLTGELVEDPSVLDRRPLAIKISNNPPSYTRPQHGISEADLVFEHITETNITRFTAIFYSRTPPDIGPVRSARLIDLELPAMYDAALAMSGAHPLVSRALFNSDFGGRILRSNSTGFYRQDDDSKPEEHRLYADPVGLWQAVEESDDMQPPRFSANMAFDTNAPEGGDPATHIEVAYSNWSLVEWDYDEEDGRYYRTVDGETFVDGNTGEQVSAANVIIIYATHIQNREICVYHDGTTCNLFTTEIQIWGQGEADIIRDGKKFDARWVRTNRSDMFTFFNINNEVVPLQIGNTWFQVVPYYYEKPLIE